MFKPLKTFSLIGLIFLVVTNNSLASVKNRQIWYGVLAPMTSESLFIESAMTAKETKVIDHVKYHIGEIGGKKIVLINSGIGLINTAAFSARLIKDFHPIEIILTGSAGSINRTLKIGDVVIAKQVFNADYGKLTSRGPSFEVADNPNPPDDQQCCKAFFSVITAIKKYSLEQSPAGDMQNN
jgi:nucleoside phosphorylase